MDSSTSKLSRRTLFAGASATGALAAVATLMPAAKPADVAVPDTQKQPPERGGGYELSEHVKRYYQTTRV
jgi:hypothetical protein